MRTTITARQAAEGVQHYLNRVLATLPPDTGTILHFQDTYPARFDQLHRWWLEHDFDILADARPLGDYLWVENDRDGFRMALQANDRPELFLMCSSPCSWPNGHPN